MSGIFGGNALHKAAKTKDWSQFKALCSEHPSQLLERDEGFNTPLHSAIANGIPSDVLINAIRIDARLVRLKDRDKNTLLHKAFEYGIGRTAALKLLRAGPQIAATQKNDEDKTPVEVVVDAKLPSAFGYSLGTTWIHYKDEYPAVLECVQDASQWKDGEPVERVVAYVGVPMDPEINAMIGHDYTY
ncbi:expressed unknown protein [Seminavis robusta]|uniref:Uncharacterized protein n=1 Tax=Seminavis robusta TaxID=568900 RepID=A0A9N8E1R3_9STRA|nr:expressed unknown protein [Seminavis robusta]|eukprot:Sro420_g139230.1 n/a (187) ;mRNA; f:8749-9309